MRASREDRAGGLMPCTRIALGGKAFAIVCGPGGYRHLVRASCPWCCLGRATTVHATRLVHSGWCANDMVCGRCGQYWSADMDRLVGTKDEQRDENRAMVAALKKRRKVGRWPRPVI